MNKTLIQIIKNTITSWGMVAVQAAIGLVMVPFLLGKLGTDGYGAIGILISIIGFAEVADLGLRAALNRELSEKVAHKDINGFRQLSSSALVLYLGLALIISVIGIIIAPFLCNLFRVGDAYRDVMILLLRTYAPITILLSFITPVFTAGICSFMRYDVQNNIAMFSQLLISALLFIFLSLFDFDPLVIWCSVMAFGGIIRLLTTGIFYQKTCFGGRIGLVDFKASSLIPLFQLGGSMYVIQLTQVLAQKMDPLIISRFLGLGNVAIYQAGSRLPQVISPIVMSLVNQIIPLTTKVHVSSDKNREQQILILGTKFTLYLGGFFCVSIFLLSEFFCDLWLREQLGDDVTNVALILKLWSIILLFNYASGAQWPILLGKKKLKVINCINIGTSIFNFALSVTLVGYVKIGVIGVLIGTAITEILRRPFVAWYVSKLINLKFIDYVKFSYLPTFLCIIASFLILTLLKDFWAFGNWVELICFGIVCTVVYALFFICFEHRSIRQLLGNR